MNTNVSLSGVAVRKHLVCSMIMAGMAGCWSQPGGAGIILLEIWIRINMKWANTDSEIAACYEVMKELRGQVTLEHFLSQVKLQKESGYQLVFESSETKIVAVAGFRIIHNLAWGKFLYIDDLVTRESFRTQGFGASLLSAITDYAIQQKCDQLHLDSGVQRTGAHRFYQNQGMDLSSYHFSKKLK
jgi:GNAT superfamily N-acetyltransferase